MKISKKLIRQLVKQLIELQGAYMTRYCCTPLYSLVHIFIWSSILIWHLLGILQGHSVTRKLKSDGHVDTMQTLHNLNQGTLSLLNMNACNLSLSSLDINECVLYRPGQMNCLVLKKHGEEMLKSISLDGTENHPLEMLWVCVVSFN